MTWRCDAESVACVHRPPRSRAEPPTTSSLDLAEHDLVASRHHEVEFAASHAPVEIDNDVARRLVVARHAALAPLPEGNPRFVGGGHTPNLGTGCDGVGPPTQRDQLSRFSLILAAFPMRSRK